MNNTANRPPVIDTEGAYDDSDLLQDFISRAREFNRPWTWTDPIREGAANLIQGFKPSTMEIERLQGLVGLDDEAFRARNQERLLGLLPQNVRDDYLRGQIEALTEWRERIGTIAGAVAPTPHREPDTWYGNAGYTALEMLPHIAAAVPMIKALGPMGYAGASTFTGNQSAQENVYDALRAQGLSPDEAREQATAFLPNAADALIRGGTNFAAMGLLNKTPMVAGASSPYSQVLKNIAMASGVSGAGAMGEQALTNYRTNTENDLAELAKTGLTAAGFTGAVGLGNALFNWRNLRELQRQYWENMKPIAVDWPPSGGDTSGNASPNRPNDPNPNGGGNTPQIEVMTPEKAARLQKQAEVLAKYNLPPDTDLWNGIADGSIPSDTAVNMLVDMGAKPDIASSIVTGSKTLADIERSVNNLSRPAPSPAQDTTRQPQTFEFNAREWQDPLFPKSRPVQVMDKPATPEIVPPSVPNPNAPADVSITPAPGIPPAETVIGTPPSDMWTDPLRSTQPNATPTPAQFLADIRAKKKQLGYDIRRQEKELGITPQKNTDIDAIERKYQRQADKADKEASIMDIFGLGANTPPAVGQQKFAQQYGNNAQAIDDVFTVPEQTQTPHVIALGNNEAYYDDEQADNSFAVNPAQLQDIPEPHTPDNRLIRKAPNVIGALGVNEAYYGNDWYSDRGGDNSSPEQDIPEAHLPEIFPMQQLQRTSFIHHDDERDNILARNFDILSKADDKKQMYKLLGSLDRYSLADMADMFMPEEMRNVHPLNTPIQDYIHLIADEVMRRKSGQTSTQKAPRVTALGNNEAFYYDDAYNDYGGDNSSPEQDIPGNKPALDITRVNTQISRPSTTRSNPQFDKSVINVSKNPSGLMHILDPQFYGSTSETLPVIEGLSDEDKAFIENLRKTNPKLAEYLESAPTDEQYESLGINKDELLSSRKGQPTRKPSDELANIAQTAPATVKPKPAPAIADTEYPFNLEDSYQGMPKSELKSAADKNNSLISSIKDETTLRKRLSGLHVPMLRAMAGISGSGYKKDDFINEIVRVATRPIPDNATLKAGEFSVPGVNGSWTVKPNKAGNSFTISNEDIPHSSMVYDPKGNDFLSLGQLDRDTTGAVQDYFRQHIKDFYENGGNQSQTVQPTAPATVAEKPAPPKSDKLGKVRLQPLGNDNPDEIAEQNIDILRRTPTDYERKKLLNAQSMTTDDLKRMRAYIKRKYNTDMGVQGKRNDIINSIVKFINRDIPAPQETEASMTPQPQPKTEEADDLPTRIVNAWKRNKFSAVALLLRKLTPEQLNELSFDNDIPYSYNSSHFGKADSMASFISKWLGQISRGENIPRIENTPIVRAFKELHTQKSENATQAISSEPETQPQNQHAQEAPKNSKRIIPPDAHLEQYQSHWEGENYIDNYMKFTVKDLAFTVRDGRNHHVESMGDVVFHVGYRNYKNYGVEHFDIRPSDIFSIHDGPLNMRYFYYDINEDSFSYSGSRKEDPVLTQSVEIAFREFLSRKYNIPFEYKKDKINYTVKNPTSENKSANQHILPDTPIVRLAQKVQSRILLNQHFTNDDLRKWAQYEFGGSKGEGKYTQKQAYDAMEMGINLAIQKKGIFPARNISQYMNTDNILQLRHILETIPTQTNRTPEQVEAQQFSTPPTLAYIVNWLANIDKGNTVLEPSAGTGNLAVFAKNAGANLILNDYSESGLRADILDALGWGKVYREDAMQLGNILAGEVRNSERSENDLPDRVIMNPPFSSAWNLGGNNKNQNGFKHVMSALDALRHGGRLVAILGAGRDGSASSVKTWLKHIGKVYNVRAFITSGGKAYQKYGTTFSNAIVVIDKTGATPKGGTAEFAFSGDFSNNEEVRKLFDAMQAIRNDIQDGDNSLPTDDSTPPKPEPPKPAPAPKNDSPKAEENTDTATTATQNNSNIPDSIKNNLALRNIHDYLDGNTDLTLKIDKAIRASMETGFRSNLQKERQIQGTILKTLVDAGIDKDTAINHAVKIIDIITHEVGYDSEALEIVKGVNSAGIPNALKEAEKILSKLDNDSYDENEQNNQDIGNQNDSNSSKPGNKKNYTVDSTTAIQEASQQQVQPQTENISNDKEQSGHIAKINVLPDNEDSPEPQPVSIYSDYEPQEHKNIHLFDIAKPHTSKLVETTNMKNVKLPPLKYEPDLPEDIIKSGNITASQLEAIAYAGQAFSKKLPSGLTQGFILGDGTGSGKGRTIAGIITDQLNHGHGNGKAIWFSVKSDLVGDARRDWQGIGNNTKDIFELGNFAVNDAIPQSKKGVLFSSYSTFITKRTVSKKNEDATETQTAKNPAEETVDESRIQQVVEWLGKDFDGVIAFDECHKINNLGETQGGWGKIEQSKSAVVASKLAQALPNARVLYVSATAATDPSQLLMFDRAGLWGKDTPFETGLMFAEAMREGGLNAMEMFARDAKSMGLFVSRSLDSSQVTYRHFTYHLSPYERKEFDQFSQAWRLIDKARNEAAIAVGDNPEDRKKESEGDFRAAQLRAYKFLIIANRVKEVIRRSKEYLQQGFSVAIMTDSTFDALVDRAVEKENKKGNPDLRDVIISPVDEMIDFVEKYITVQAVNEVQTQKPDGGFITEYKPAFDSYGKPIISQTALRIKNTLIANLRQIYFNMSPIDEIINALGGPDNVAEVTGRKHRLIKQQDGSIKDLGAPPKADAEREAFNNWQIPKKQKGKIVMEPCQKRVIIFSTGKGGTGFSLHADRSYKNQQRRVLIPLDFGFGAINATQGFGRVNRSNQVSAPEYCVVSTDIPGEIRLLSSISRALGKMGAITAGERKSTTQGIFSEKDNLDSKYAASAMNLVIANMNRPDLAYPELENPGELLVQMGLIDEDDPEGKIKQLPIDKIFNRILLLDLDMQEKLMTIFRQAHEYILARAIQHGQADVGTEYIRAQSVNILQETTLLEDKEKGISTKLLEIEYTVRSRIRSFDNASRINYCSEFYTDQLGQIYGAKKSGERDGDGKLIRPSVEIKDGRAVQRYVLFTPDFAHSYNADADDLQNKKPNAKRVFTPVPDDKAKALWEEESEGISRYHTDTIYLVSGVMLPIWNQINKAASQRVMRITAPDGTSILGREIEKSKVHLAVQIFKANFAEHKFSAQEVIDKLQKRGSFARLDNNWKIKFSTVSGEQRLEVFNMGRYADTYAKDYDLLTEIIGSDWRFFIPIGRNDILDNLLKKHPVYNFDDDMSADDVRNEAITKINSSIPDDKKDYIIHPSFWGFINDPDDNPLIHTSNYPLDSEPREYRYQASKNADSSKSVWQHIKDLWRNVRRGQHDIPELADDNGHIDDSMLKAQEWLRDLNRRRQANIHETEQDLRIILDGLSPDDFDLFQRAMELRDLEETRSKDPNADMPWDLNISTLYDFDATDPVHDNYATIMYHVSKNPRVQEAMRKADTLMEDMRQKLIEHAERLGLFDVRDRLSRKHYFRHLVLQYYNMQRSGKPHPTFKNPTARGYMKHREGSEKDISSNWILAMGEVFSRMMDDVKILGTLYKLRNEYDIIEDLRKMALDYNMENALARIMHDLQDVPEELRKAAAEKKLGVALNATQARAMTRLFNLAKKGDLPTGENHQWDELVARMAEAGLLDNLFAEEQDILSRYIGWLSHLPTSTPARKAAKTFLTGIKSRVRAMKNIVGNDYLDWKELIPEDYTIWSPSDSRLVFSASSLPEYMLKIATENIDALLDADASDIGKMIQAGGDKQLWVIPTRLADALDNIGKSQPQGTLGNIMSGMMGAFKRWVTIGPAQGRLLKYNWRNFFGDLEAVLQGNPGALYYLKQAAEEISKVMLKGGIATGTLAEFQKRGGGLTTAIMTELERPDRIKAFSDLYEHKKTMNPMKWGVNLVRSYIDIATTITNFRESILRYASFLSYIQLIRDNNGVPPFYGMSKPEEVKAVGDDIFDIAFKLANENLGAYDQVSANTQWLRDNNFMSFLSWVEVNAKRYIRNIKGIWQGNSYLEWWIKRNGQKFIDTLTGGGAGNGNGGNNQPPKNNNSGDFHDDDGNNEFRKIFRRVAKKSGVGALRLAITLALAAPLWLMLALFNKLNSENDEKLPPDVRNKPHLTLWTNPFTGEVLYLGDVGSAFDALQMFGVGNLITGDIRDLLDGRTTFGEVAANILDGPVSKFVSNTNPFAKAVIEGFFGKRTFPSALHPSPIRDKGKFIAQSFGLDWYYDFLTDKPHKPFYDFSSSVVNSAQQDKSAYFYILSRKKQFEENVLGKSSDYFTDTRRGDALRNAKAAADLGDRKALRKYMREYFRAGGSEQGLKISARSMNPLYGLNDADELRFIRWLPKEERKILRRAMRYAEIIKAKLGVW